MASDLAPPVIPDVDEFDVLDLELLAGKALATSIYLDGATPGLYVHPHWRGTAVDGTPVDWIVSSTLIQTGYEVIQVDIAPDMLEAIANGHALYTYTIQVGPVYEHGYDEARRKHMLVGKRYFPGAGATVAVINEANQLQVDHSNLGNGASVAILPWQAMATGDVLTMTWLGYTSNGSARPEYIREVTVQAHEVGFPVVLSILKNEFVPIRGGRGLLTYEIEYADTGKTTVGPVQTFSIIPAGTDYLAALTIEGHSTGAIDPDLFSAGVTFNIDAFPDLNEGDALVIYVEDMLASTTTPLAGLRLDLSTVDSGRLQCRVAGDWLYAYLDRDIRLTYHVARPQMDCASRALELSVQRTMSLPMPVVQGASGQGLERGEFKAQDTADGIKVWVPGLAVYPGTAGVEMHWQGFGDAGSHVQQLSTGDTPPAFMIPPAVVAPNVGKDVEVFYRVKVAPDNYRDSAIFIVKVLPIPQYGYPTLNCVQADGGILSLARVPAGGSTQTIAKWPLMAVGQKMLLTATGTLNGGGSVTQTMLNNMAVNSTHVNNGVSVALEKTWLQSLQVGRDITFTMQVSADDGNSYVVFPRVYVTLAR